MRGLLTIVLFICSFITFSQTNSLGGFNAFSQSQFDSDTCCWRVLSKTKKYKEAAELIVSYLHQSINVKNAHSLYWVKLMRSSFQINDSINI